MPPKLIQPLLLLCLSLGLQGCFEAPAPEDTKVYRLANRCFAVRALAQDRATPERLSVSDSGDAYDFSAESTATLFYLKPSGLGRYLLYDDGESYLASDGTDLLREDALLSDVLTIDDEFESGAEWSIETVPAEGHLRIQHVLSGRYLAARGLVDDSADAAAIQLVQRSGCAEFPEASLDAEGRVQTRRFPDGSLFGFVDTHSHLLSNFAFGGGGMFHGAPFHPLGVEHALADCAVYHGEDGRKDLFGFGFDSGGQDPTELILALINGETSPITRPRAGRSSPTGPAPPTARPTRPSTTVGSSARTWAACGWWSSTRRPTRSSAT